jgi:GntR family transcriptional regulator
MVPSVRQIAEGLQINPMTVSKAWSVLERDGVLERVRGQGMRVLAAAKPRATVKERQQALQPLLEQVVIQAAQLSLSREQVLAAMAAALKELPGE